MSAIQNIDVRIQHNAPLIEKRVRAAKAACRFIRRQVEAKQPASKEELVHKVWRMYFKMLRAGLLAAPKTTRRMLRAKYGFWTTVNTVKQ